MFPGQDAFIGESGLYVIIQSYSVIDTVAEKAAKLAAKEVSMHVSPKKGRRKKRRLIPIVATATSAADGEELHEEKDPPIFQACRLSLLEDSSDLPCLYIVHVDSIVGPTVVISDISREYAGNHDLALALGHPSRPYIFMSRRRDQWADNWTSFIDWQYQKTVHDQVAESSEDDD